MTTPRSSFDAGRVRRFAGNVLHRSRGLIVFYTVLLTLALPVPFAVTVYNAWRRPAPADPYLLERGWTWAEYVKDMAWGASHVYNGFSSVFLTVIAAVIPLVLSVTLLGYMHDRRAVDVYHSLPLTRGELFLANAVSAALIMWAPMAAAFALTGAVAAFVPGMSLLLILKDLFFWCSAMLAVYAVAAFCATQVGTVQDQLLFTLVVSGSLSVVGLLLNVLAESYLYGYVAGDSFYNVLYRLCPFSLMVGRYLASSQPYYSDSNLAAVLWLIFSAVLLAASALLYSRRKSEQAEVLGNMGALQLYVRLVGTLVGGVCVGFLIAEFLGVSGSDHSFLLCAALGGLLVYPIGDAVLARRVRSPKKILPVWLLSVAVSLLFCAATMYDFFGYEKRVPAAENVASVTVEGFRTRYASQNNERSLTLKDSGNVARTIAAHRAQIAGGSGDRQYTGQRLWLTYTLKNGRKMQRCYEDVAPEALPFLEELETDGEVLEQTAAVFRLASDPASLKVNRITVTDAADGASAEMKLTAEENKALLDALRADLLEQPQSELESGGRPLAVVRVEYAWRPGESPWEPVATKEAVSEDGEHYTLYDYLVTESFTRTRDVLSRLREVREKEIGDGSLRDVTAVSLWLHPDGMRFDNRLYYSCGSVDNATDILYYYRDESGVLPFHTVTGEDFAPLWEKTFAYCPNREDVLRHTVEVLLYKGDPAAEDPCGVVFIRLSDLPKDWQEDMIRRYREYNDDTEYRDADEAYALEQGLAV